MQISLIAAALNALAKQSFHIIDDGADRYCHAAQDQIPFCIETSW
jgi:hypothetical protein